MRSITLGLSIAVVLSVMGCHSSTMPSTTVTNVTVTVPAFVIIGASVQATATATLSNGTTSADVTWSVDATAVATVSASGLVTGHSAGQVTLTATSQGRSGTQTLRVLPDFHGTWTGNAVSLSCQATGGFDCSGVSIGAALPLVLRTLTQTNDSVAGVVDLQEIVVSATGLIAVNGTLTLTGSQSLAGDATFDSVTLKNWQTSGGPQDTMTGTFSLSFSKTGTTGTVVINLTLQSVVRSPPIAQ